MLENLPTIDGLRRKCNLHKYQCYVMKFVQHVCSVQQHEETIIRLFFVVLKYKGCSSGLIVINRVDLCTSYRSADVGFASHRLLLYL